MLNRIKILALLCAVSLFLTLLAGISTVYASQSPYSPIQGESWNSMSGVANIANAVGFIENGDWVKYSSVDFGGRGTNGFQVDYTSNGNGGTIEIWIDGLSGTKIGQITVPGTGGWSNWQLRTVTNLTTTAGVHDVYLKFFGGASYLFDIDWFMFNETSESEAASLGGNPVPSTSTNVPGYTGSGYVEEFRLDGQYIAQSFNVPVSGIYELTYRYDTVFNNSSRVLYVNDVLKLKNLKFPKTCEDWSTWGTVTFNLYLNSGFNTIKLKNDRMYNGEYATVYVDSLTLRIANVGVEYNGTKNIPGVVQAEEYNAGPSGLAYYDTSPGNNGGVGRSNEDVDIAALPEGGYKVNYVDDGEWLNYTVNVLSAGDYGIKINTAVPYDGIKITYYVDGINFGSYPVKKTVDYSTFVLSDGPKVFMTAGTHVFKIKAALPKANYFVDIDYINIGSFAGGFSTSYESEAGTQGGNPAPTTSSTSHKEFYGTGFVEYFYLDGQYSQITANVPVAGKYLISYRYTAPTAAKRAIYVNGTRVVDSFSFPSTVNWEAWYNAGFIAQLNAGSNTIKCQYDSSRGSEQYLNLDYVNISFQRQGDPYPGTHTLPGTVQFEDFDSGGQNVSFFDSTSGNSGGQYRTGAGDDVDIGNASGPGYYINYIAANEWWNYTVEVSKTQNYDLTYNADCPYSGKKIRIYLDGAFIGDYTLTQTGSSFGTFATMSGPQKLLLTKGTHQFRFESISSLHSFDLNWFNLSASFTVSPGIVTPTAGFTPNDVIVKTVSVTEYGASPGSESDATAAFQNALDTVGALGGGVVFVPSGTYHFDGHLKIPNSVTLRGEWKSPDSGGLGVGTILKAYENKDNENGSPFITMTMSAGVKNIGIWYPEQDYSSIHAYPYTIQGDTRIDDDVVFNVTLYNSYNGIRLGQDVTGNGRNVFRNIYGTVLKTGIWHDNDFDTSRCENINFGITFWANSGLSGAPSTTVQQNTLKSYTRAHTVGFDYGRVDWGYLYGINLSDMLCGMKFRQGDNGYGNFSISQASITDVNVGMDIQKVTPGGIQFTNGTISASVGSSPYGVLLSAQDTTISFCNTIFGGSPHTAIKITGDRSTVNLNNAVFSDWGYSGGTYAIESQKGAIVVEKCNFQQNKKHINLTSGTTGAVILSNTFTGGAQIDNTSPGNIVINHNTLSIPTPDSFSYTFNTERKPASTTNFYNVMSSPYNAAADGTADDTSAVQSALNAAGSAGGGTVYMPAGIYKISTSLSVPAGVELRGCSETIPHGGIMSGTEIRAYGGKDNAGGTPLITLNQNAGLRGINIFYPEQDFMNPHAYPWTVRGAGSGCWVYNCSFINAYQGVDMLTNPCSNNMIASNTGFAFNCAFQIGNNITSGYIEDNMFNPNAWFNGDRPGTPHGSYNSDVLYPYLESNATGMKLGRCSNYNNFQNFFIFMNTSFKLIDDAGGSYSGTLYSPGSDSCENGFVIEKGGTVNIYNYIGANPFTNADIALFKTTGTFAGTLNVYNSVVAGGENSKIANLNGGTTNFTQITNTDDKNIKVNAGTFKGCGIVCMHYNNTTYLNDFEFGSGMTSAVLLGNIGRSVLNITDNSGGKLSSANNATY